MSDRLSRMMELALQGFGCSQILVMEALQARGETSPELLRAVSALHGGLGFSGRICGALTGGCCALGLYAGKGAKGETEDPRLTLMVNELVDWFESEFKPHYGGIDCADILQDDPKNRLTRCPEIVTAVSEKIAEILKANDYDPEQGSRG
jgi:C_GCAxxG_C_C family probable redox protein